MRIQQKRVDPTTGDEVAYEDIVKGYELTPDRYVIIEPGELEALDPKKTKSIEIEDFVSARRDRPDLLRSPVLPRARARRRQALPAAARGDARDRPRRDRQRRHPPEAAARRGAADGRVALSMSTMVYPDEVVDPTSIDELAAAEDIEINKRELDIAKQLVDSLAGPFELDKYQDTYREEVLALVERKAQGEEIAVQPTADEDEAPVPDLMSALKASLDAVKARDGNGGSSSAKKAPAKKSAAKKPAQEVPGEEDGREELAARAAIGYEKPSSHGHRRRPHPPFAAPAALEPERAGLHAAALRQGLHVPRRGGRADHRQRARRADRRARHPARLAGRLDLARPVRPHPGDRDRRPRAQAVPLPPALARAPRPGEVRGHDRLRAAPCPRCARSSSTTSRSATCRASRCSPAPRACWTAASSGSARRSTRSPTRPTAWRRSASAT